MDKLRLILSKLTNIKETSGDIYRQVKSALTTHTCSDSVSIFSYAEKHPLRAPGGIFSDDGLILTHLTDYLPSADGYIETAKSSIGAARDSVHFAVNHGVKAHELGSWDAKKFSILIPMKSALKEKENNFAGGIATDFYSKGRVKIPKGTVILRFNDKLPKGKYRIKDASVIKEFRRLKGVKVIETNGDNMKTFTDDVIKKLGYELKDTTSPYYWGKNTSSSGYQAFNRFNKWQRTKGFLPSFHTYTPNAKIEMLIQNIMTRSDTMNEWTYVKDGATLFDSKSQILKLLDEIQKYAKNSKYPLDINVNTLKQIIKDSASPKESLVLLKDKLGIKATMSPVDKVNEFKEQPREIQEVGLFSHLAGLVGGNKGMSIAHNAIEQHLKKASKTTNSHIEDCIPDFIKAVMEFCQKIGVSDINL